jgi:two-component system sensor histidine kinase KdpD
VARRTWFGVAASAATLALFTLAMLPLREHLAVATDALLLIVPVVAGVAVGGFGAGVVGALAGFVIYDWFFIPPYGTLTVSLGEDWAALVVYLAVVLIVARVVAFQQSARDRAALREAAIGRLFAVTEQLISARPLGELLDLVAATVHQTFASRWVAVLLPVAGRLEVTAVAGDAASDAELLGTLEGGGSPQSMALVSADRAISRVALITEQGPVGQLVIAGVALSPLERELLGTFANQAALAIERSQLRERAERTEMLETADRWRNALVGAVSHDLRTPLASMKLAVSTLRHEGAIVSAEDRAALLEMIEDQCDQLARLVTNLLDMARVESGNLVLARGAHSVGELLEAARGSLGRSLSHHELVADVDASTPLVDVDLVLIAQVLANLLVNAAQHSPSGSPIEVGATTVGAEVRVSVRDRGPGVAPGDQERLFHMLDRRAGSGRAGLGLAIAAAFVGAHGGVIGVEDAPGGGARFFFTVPVAELDGDE